MRLGKISSDDLKLLVAHCSQLFNDDLPKARQALVDNETMFFSENAATAVWCQLYELPARDHFLKIGLELGMEGLLRELAQSQNQLQAIPGTIEKIGAEIDAEQLTDEEAETLRKSLQVILGLSLSIANSLRSVLVFGCYLNDLIAKVRAGGRGADNALLCAVKIDVSVLGCPSVIPRISQAVLKNEQKFLDKVRHAMSGRFSKREQKNHQTMRLILQVLHESGAGRLSAGDLYTLFREQLNLVRDEAGEGDVKNALRQFAYQYMRNKAVSENT